VPLPIKIQEQHLHLFPTDRPITRESGRALAEWCTGGAPAAKIDGALVARGWEAAQGGTVALRGFWSGLGKAEQASLKALLDEKLKPIAQQFDLDAAGVPMDDEIDPPDDPPIQAPRNHADYLGA
jgi:hypothetical protein